MTESAIEEHFTRERTIPARTPQNYHPAYPVYTARWSKSATDLVMAVLGMQFASKDDRTPESRVKLFSFLESKGTDGATRRSFFEVASVTDASGYYNEAIIAYWPSNSAYKNWAAESGFQAWWDGLDPERGSHGWFMEVFFPTMDRIETAYTNNEIAEGAAHLKDSISGAITEHGYWGSMRDRLPTSQTRPLEVTGQTGA
ncbi:hypothetical protein NPX13_g6285 [Xylaria arbuscula]|uniref:Phenylacetaldoxime dehydratase n=1 Tax=Xylaria arbuscula TaxID=114810 RepID=A0A9W8TLW6_9PEZI|nr:hypothetical protein NPX13_g6285 [Xylaria arbuscula]